MCCGYGKVSACGDFVGGMFWVWRLIFERKNSILHWRGSGGVVGI